MAPSYAPRAVFLAVTLRALAARDSPTANEQKLRNQATSEHAGYTVGLPSGELT